MKVNYILENGYIVAYTAVPFNSAKPSIEISEEDIKYLMTKKCKVLKGHLDRKEAEEYLAEKEKVSSYKAELLGLEAWFKCYDEKTAQYTRHIRLYGTSDIDIAELDKQAEVNAARIKELKGLLK